MTVSVGSVVQSVKALLYRRLGKASPFLADLYVQAQPLIEQVVLLAAYLQ